MEWIEDTYVYNNKHSNGARAAPDISSILLNCVEYALLRKHADLIENARSTVAALLCNDTAAAAAL